MREVYVVSQKQKYHRKILITLGLVIAFLGLSFIPVPFLNERILTRPSSFEWLDKLAIFLGGPFGQVTFMGTGLSAYITASIVVQLLVYLNKDLYTKSRLPGGKEVIEGITLYVGLTVAFILSLIQLIPLVTEFDILSINPWIAIPFIVLFQMLGTWVTVQIGFGIENHGLGNGISVLLMVNILSSFPLQLYNVYQMYVAGDILLVSIILYALIILLIIIGLVLIQTSDYVVPVVFSKAVTRGKIEEDEWRFKLNQNGVMPIILASFAVGLLQMLVIFILGYVGGLETYDAFVTENQWVIVIVMAGLVLLFNRIYSFLQFDAYQLNQQLQNETGQIVGLNPGKETIQYLNGMNKKLSNISGFVLILLILIPEMMRLLFNIPMGSSTSLMIVIGVWLELISEVKSERQLIALENSTLYDKGADDIETLFN